MPKPARELEFTSEPFALVPETASDGDRIAAEQQAKQQDQQNNEKKQTQLWH